MMIQKSVFGAKVLLLIVCLWIPQASLAALQACVTIEGETQGAINDGPVCEQFGGQDGILVLGYGHSVVVPTDALSGLPTGQRVHHPLKILKAVSRSTPLLNQALVTGERLNRVRLRFYRPNQEGALEHFFTITLDDATVTNITTSASSDEQSVMQELISMSYRMITWKDEISGIETTDDWRAPRT